MNTERPVDSLSGLASLLRVRPELQAICRFGLQWASDHATERDRWAPFHFITQGTCVVDLPEVGRTIPLSAGDVLVLPHGSAHVLRGPTTPAGACGPFGIRAHPMGAIDLKSNTDREPETQLICGRLRFEWAHNNLVLAALPDTIVVSTSDHASGALQLGMLISAIQEELDGARPGAKAIATDLASALFLIVVRAHLCGAGADSGLLALLAHRQLGRAIAAMVDDPAKDWSLDELASCANASRASLVRMFRYTAKQSPLAFLAWFRLELARRKLSVTGMPLAALGRVVNSGLAVGRFGSRP